MPDSLWPFGPEPARLLCPWDSPGKNTGVGCQALLQGIFSTQESNPRCLLHLLHHRRVPYGWAAREALPAWKVLLRGAVGEAWGCSAYLAGWSWWRAWGAWRWRRHRQSANSEQSRGGSHKGLVAPGQRLLCLSPQPEEEEAWSTQLCG